MWASAAPGGGSARVMASSTSSARSSKGTAWLGMSASMWILIIIGLCGGELWLLGRIHGGVLQRYPPLYPPSDDSTAAMTKYSRAEQKIIDDTFNSNSHNPSATGPSAGNLDTKPNSGTKETTSAAQVPSVTMKEGKGLADVKSAKAAAHATQSSPAMCDNQSLVDMSESVLVWLATRIDDYSNLAVSILTCHQYFGRHHSGLNFLVFLKLEHRNKTATTTLVRSLEESIGSSVPLQFHYIEFEYPECIQKNPNWESMRNLCAIKYIRGNYDYFFMNQFFISGLYEHPSMQPFSYYLRIDSDAWFTKDIPCSINPFNLYGKRVAQANEGKAAQPLFFVYPARKPIALSACSDGLFDFIDAYRQAQGILTPGSKWSQALGEEIFHGYMGSGNLTFFRSERYRRVAKAIVEDGRVFINRWVLDKC